MKYSEIRQDLFDVSSSYALGHCISWDCKMGAGIAVEFDKMFPNMKTRLIRTLAQEKEYYPHTRLFEDGNIRVLNIITKPKYFMKPTQSSMYRALISMRKVCLEHKINKVAIPRIGAGLDKLDWDYTSNIIKEIFRDTDIEILVCVL